MASNYQNAIAKHLQLARNCDNAVIAELVATGGLGCAKAAFQGLRRGVLGEIVRNDRSAWQKPLLGGDGEFRGSGVGRACDCASGRAGVVATSRGRSLDSLRAAERGGTQKRI